jgi:arsenate reductase (glutaredoxin)
VDVEEVDLSKGLSSSDIEHLVGGRDYREFLNPRNELYRERNMKEHPPSREDAIQLMSKNPNLIRRPILVKGGRMVLGWDEQGFKDLI